MRERRQMAARNFVICADASFLTYFYVFLSIDAHIMGLTCSIITLCGKIHKRPHSEKMTQEAEVCCKVRVPQAVFRSFRMASYRICRQENGNPKTDRPDADGSAITERRHAWCRARDDRPMTSSISLTTKSDSDISTIK